MKSRRNLMCAVVVAGLSLASAFAQADAKPADQKMVGMDHSQKTAAPKSEAQVSFEAMKAALAGEWEGAISTDMPEAMKKAMGADGPDKALHVTLRVTSRGNLIVHEFQEANTVTSRPARAIGATRGRSEPSRRRWGWGRCGPSDRCGRSCRSGSVRS